MQSFLTVTGPAAPLPQANVDTDVIMPKQFLKGIDRSGLADGVFHALRFDTVGVRRPEFILNRPGWEGVRFLLVGPNFGCGSSREHAVWGLLQLGVRAVIGTSFAGIFFDNCARNGLLALTVAEAPLAELFRLAGDARTNRLEVDLPAQRIISASGELEFDIDAARKEAMVRGLDQVGTTLQHQQAIAAFECAHLHDSPWLA